MACKVYIHWSLNYADTHPPTDDEVPPIPLPHYVAEEEKCLCYPTIINGTQLGRYTKDLP